MLKGDFIRQKPHSGPDLLDRIFHCRRPYQRGVHQNWQVNCGKEFRAAEDSKSTPLSCKLSRERP